MERRKAIKQIGLSFGALVGTPSLVTLLQSCQTQETPWTPTFFSEMQGVFVRKLADTLLPQAGNLPSASEVNVHAFIDKYCQEVLPVDLKPSFRSTLEAVIQSLLADAGETEISNVDASAYGTMLKTHLVATKEEHKNRTAEIAQYLAENGNDPSGMNKKLRFYDFLNNFRDMSIWAYRTNETVGETIMAYKPVPGEQQGCVDLEATTGGMAWSLTW